MELEGKGAEALPLYLEIKHVLRTDKSLFMLVLLSSIITFFIIHYFENEITYEYQFRDYLSMVIGCLYATFLAWSIYLYFKFILSRENKPTKKYVLAIKNFFTPINKPIVFIVRILILNICFSNYTYLKQIIPDINPFKYDQLFSNLDFWIHGEKFPWEWTHTFFSHSIFTYFFMFSYQIWFVLIWGSFLYFLCACKIENYRQQYLLSFLLSWFFLGSIMALLLSSAGPCFLNHLKPSNNTYLPLLEILESQMQFLDNIPFYQGNVINVQNYLWDIYVNGDTNIGAGISAMPSMHVSSSVLMALGAYQVNRTVGMLFWIYALIIQIASVHLGWHYAVDGYFSFIATLFVWFSVKLFLSLKFPANT